jgi:hypothetical protein
MLIISGLVDAIFPEACITLILAWIENDKLIEKYSRIFSLTHSSACFHHFPFCTILHFLQWITLVPGKVAWCHDDSSGMVK